MKKQKKLGQLAATAICGNDISSSVLYVCALAIAFAGKYAWITLVIVSLVLFLYRKIYGEVVGALPLNGGAYNALLNTTNKATAAFAATLTLLSYMATAVISGNEAIHYLHHIVPSMPIITATIALLSVFAFLVIVGITESSRVAIGIFLFHLGSLLILTGFIVYFLFQNGIDILIANWQLPVEGGSITKAIFFGFAASMLGVSGFESSANFVEEQKRGVFPKTLRNMWAVVSIVNPLMAVFALALFALPVLSRPEFQNTLIVEMGQHVGGEKLVYIIAIDAFLVLSGAVLTAFVGVTGLLERMALDRIIPPFFLKKNKKGSSYRIIIVFLFLTVSVLLITKGNVGLLAGVYSISFLSVMALFGMGNILLKIKRAQLPRPERASGFVVFLAIVAVLIALIGNIIMPSKNGLSSNLTIFLYYFIPTMTLVTIMLNRTMLLKLSLKLCNEIFHPIRKVTSKADRFINKMINKINDQQFVFFSRGNHIASLNQVMLYIKRNEHTKKVKIVTVIEKGAVLEENLKREIDVLDREYPKIKIEFVVIEGEFTPELIEDLSKKWKIPVNFMFIGSPSDKFPYRIEELGGVRLII